ncbi:hypothetical protein A2368_03115 [Candidatus Collierbacteria bacterium RIFOXYB1_FULL_49_13]|uniref:Uncharacterized protein n=1 Tax=Candidatus Collierbacteria bacterium RIFOXYB1_FULL_49_13 TaxID=1817728 RepID=A0A1F5FK22_9BACT|nr:MAG: hypothetical protein A2368_03115 [Candidatus Collierbacteria bacterium RIFOXYB1_FULL_49_13]
MLNRYNFKDIFGINSKTGDIFPLFNMMVNGQYFVQYFSIPRGLAFGGIDIYRFVGRSFTGYWNNTNKVLTIAGVI